MSKKRFQRDEVLKTIIEGKRRKFPGDDFVLSINNFVLWLQDWELIQYKRHLIERYLDA